MNRYTMLCPIYNAFCYCKFFYVSYSNKGILNLNLKKTCVKHCYDDLLSCCEFWFAIICIDVNVILDLSAAIQQFYRRFQ